MVMYSPRIFFFEELEVLLISSFFPLVECISSTSTYQCSTLLIQGFHQQKYLNVNNLWLVCFNMDLKIRDTVLPHSLEENWNTSWSSLFQRLLFKENRNSVQIKRYELFCFVDLLGEFSVTNLGLSCLIRHALTWYPKEKYFLKKVNFQLLSEFCQNSSEFCQKVQQSNH